MQKLWGIEALGTMGSLSFGTHCQVLPMGLSNPAALDKLQADLTHLVARLPELEHGSLIQRALQNILLMAEEDLERLDWKILQGSLQDMEHAFRVFAPYRHVRKVAVFGSARTPETDPDYSIAFEFSKCMAAQGFVIMTGAGGGIMEAANKGAGRSRSFGLNVQLPFEQSANAFIEGDEKLLTFKYFFTRKLFFLRETDAVIAFPGGFGTMDELFECLTLIQTGKFGPSPLVLVDRPGGDYWQEWEKFSKDQLRLKGLISPEDHHLYTITDRIDVACQAVSDFYSVYHSSRYVGPMLVLRLKVELADADVEAINRAFEDILVTGAIEKTAAFPEELADETVALPRLKLHYDQRNTGRLYQLIAEINRRGAAQLTEVHPEQK